jgi:hypothetical protein
VMFHRRKVAGIGARVQHYDLICPRPCSETLFLPTPSTISPGVGLVTEWLCSGLQIRVPRFDSGRGLQFATILQFNRPAGFAVRGNKPYLLRVFSSGERSAREIIYA